MASYHHFTQEERAALSALLRAEMSQKEAARQLNKDPSSVSRELKRNRRTEGGYHAGYAARTTSARRIAANRALRKIAHDPRLTRYVVRKLQRYWSPEQIAGRVKRDRGITLCHETIYQYVYRERPDLKQYLRCQKGKYRRRYGTKLKELQREEAKKRRIDQRPEIIGERGRVGDWEGDTVVGARGTGSLVTHVERASGYAFIDLLGMVTAEEVQEKTIQRFRVVPKQKRHTITYDNGSEFAGFEWIERLTGMVVYFAYPYHSWERGTNENTNGLIRQFFPKKTSFVGITVRATRRAAWLLNTRPRKRLGYLTPVEVFNRNCALT